MRPSRFGSSCRVDTWRRAAVLGRVGVAQSSCSYENSCNVMSSGSVTIRYRRFQEGDLAAAEWLWRRYGPELLQLARSQLKNTPQAISDEEDVVQNAFSDFCAGVAEGEFHHVESRRELWGLLALITTRKASNLRRYHLRMKRRASSTVSFTDQDIPNGHATVADSGLPPDLRAEMEETLVQLIDCLNDPVLQQIATWVLEGCDQDEIARRLNCVPRTVRRKLQLIRAKWLTESGDEH